MSRRYVRKLSPSFGGGYGGNSFVITKAGFKYKSSERRTPVTLGNTKMSTMVTRSFTEVFCEGTAGIKVPLLRTPKVDGLVRSKRRVRMSVRGTAVGSRGKRAVAFGGLPPFVLRVLRRNNLVRCLGGGEWVSGYYRSQ